MSAPLPEPNQACAQCAASLAPGALLCTSCNALVHAARLQQLAESAQLHEQQQDIVQARTDWQSALALLPADLAQAEWIRGNLQRLDAMAAPANTSQRQPRWAAKLGPFAPLAILLVKGKFLLTLFKFKFLFSLGTFVAFYWALYGAKFGIGFAVLILVHEMGHFIAIKLRGLPADMPVFLPGLGAYVRWSALGVSVNTRSLVSLAGPLAGCIGAALCAIAWINTGNELWIGLASMTAVLNVLNLIPVWVLDGGQAIATLNKAERIVLAAAAVGLAALFGQPLFLLVAAGAAYRVFDKDLPVTESPWTTAYYLSLLAALGYLIQMAPVPSTVS
jgi:Zn-dependent protease